MSLPLRLRPRLLLALTLASAVVGCNFGSSSAVSNDAGPFEASSTQPGSVVVLSASPGTEDFGTVQVGSQSAAAMVTVTNTGTSPSGGVAVALSGASSGDFGIDSDGCADKALPAGSSCSVQVHFKPTKTASEEATLSFTSDPGGSATVALSGVGGGLGALSFAPSTQDLGTAAIGAVSAPATFTLTNTGSAATGNVAVALSGTDGVDFSIASDGCSGKPLPAGGTCSVGVGLTPKTTGTKAATLTATASGTPGTATASLSGTAASGAAFAVTPSPFDFGSVSQGQSPAPEQTFTVKNTGGVASGIPTIAAGGSKDFAIASNGCSTALSAGATCTFGVTFSPTGVGSETTVVSVSATSVKAVAVSVQGTGLAPAAIGISPTSQALGSVVQGAVGADSPFVLTNGGGVATGALAVQLGGTNGDQFALGTDGCTGQTLAAGASCTVNAHSAPKVGGPVGALQASLQVSGTPGGTTAATLTATAISQAALSIAPTSQAMGTVAQGSSSGDLAFVVTNGGGTASGKLQATLSNTTQFGLGVDQCSGQVLDAGASCTVNVHFAPGAGSALGTQVTALSVTGSPGGTATANLTGTTASPAALQITPASEPFPSAAQGTAGSDVTFTVSNGGGVASGILKATLGGANGGQFAIGTDGCSGHTLPANKTGTCAVTAHFAPSVGTLGLQQATLSVTGAPGGTATANLTGTATTPLSITPANPTLASGAYQSPGATTTLTVTSVSLAGVGPLAITLPAQFSLDGAKTTCSGATLTKATPTCTVGVYLNPTGPTIVGAVTGTLTVGVGANTSATDVLAATALTPATLAITTAAGAALPFNFGTIRQHVGSTQSFTLTNKGGVPSGGVSVAISGAPPGSTDFAVVNNGCAAGLGPNGSCGFQVTFTPSTTASETATLGATTVAGLPTSGTLNGTGGQAVLAFENANAQVITSYPYGGVFVSVVGTVVPPATATFSVVNKGTSATSNLSQLGTLAAGYNVTSDACAGKSLLPGGTPCTVTVTFQNATPCAEVSTTLTMTDGVVSAPLALSATGISSAVDYQLTSSANPMHLAPGAKGTFTFTLTNCGVAPTQTGYNIANLYLDANALYFQPLPYTNDGCTGHAALGELQSCSFQLNATAPTTAGTVSGYVLGYLGNQQSFGEYAYVTTP